MKQDKKLILGMALLFFVTFVSLGTIVVTEKLAPYYTDKIKIKMEEYLNEHYQQEIENIKLEKITYQAQIYTAKVTNKKNKNLYFTISYQNKKITDTYKKDYLEGKTLLSKIETQLEKKIKDSLKLNATITFPLTLNKYTNNIKNNIINNKIDELNIYNLNLTLNYTLSEENINNLVAEIKNTVTKINNLHITPNHYTIKINSKQNGKVLTIKNLTNKTLELETLTQIMNYIMIGNENNIVNNIIKENNINYEYKRYGDE